MKSDPIRYEGGRGAGWTELDRQKLDRDQLGVPGLWVVPPCQQPRAERAIRGSLVRSLQEAARMPVYITDTAARS